MEYNSDQFLQTFKDRLAVKTIVQEYEKYKSDPLKERMSFTSYLFFKGLVGLLEESTRITLEMGVKINFEQNVSLGENMDRKEDLKGTKEEMEKKKKRFTYDDGDLKLIVIGLKECIKTNQPKMFEWITKNYFNDGRPWESVRDKWHNVRSGVRSRKLVFEGTLNDDIVEILEATRRGATSRSGSGSATCLKKEPAKKKPLLENDNAIVTLREACRSIKLVGDVTVPKISRLIYANSGNAILALASNGIHQLWKWQNDKRNSGGKATASVPPQLWQPSSGILMTNDVAETNPEESVPCLALSKNESYLISSSGGKISLFNMMTFKRITTFMPPPPAATFLAFYPLDNNIFVIGMDDSTIHVYDVRSEEVISKLKGHSKRISGLVFSCEPNVLVSSGADAQLCVWSPDVWEKQKARFLKLPARRTLPAQSDTRIQFHQDKIHLLVVHETQLAIYMITNLEPVNQWIPRDSASPISHATFSCDSQLVYAGFFDATICIFTGAHLRPLYRIDPLVYLTPIALSHSNIHPLVIAAHPQEPNQFALGLSDGIVHVFEPLESESKWGGPASSHSNASGSEQP